MKQLLIITILLLSFSASAVIIGSNTIASRQGLAIFPFGDGDNEMRGFAAFENGFTLNGGGSCLFNSLYPVSGDITINGGALNLNKDLICEKNVAVINGGTIVGNGYSMQFLVPSTITIPQNLIVSASASFITQINVGKDVTSVSWSHDNNHITTAKEFSDFGNAYDFSDPILSASGSVEADDVINSEDWHPTVLYLAVGANKHDNSPFREHLQVWSYNPTTDSFSIVSEIKPNRDCVAVEWHPSGNYLAAGFRSGSDELIIYSFASETLSPLHVTNFANDRDVQRNAISWEANGDYLAVGTAVHASADELLVYSFNGASLSLHASSNVTQTVSAVRYSPTGEFIAVGLSSGSERIRVYSHDVGAGTLTERTAARVGESLSVLSLDWSPDGNYLAIGRDFGNGTEFRVYQFDKVEHTLTVVMEFAIAGSVCAVRWSSNGNYIAVGDRTDFLSVYEFTNASATGDITFNNIKLIFNSDVIFQNQITFQGTCAIDAKGHTLTISNGSNVVVDAGASLYLQDAIIKNVSGTNIQCINGASRIYFDNSILTMSGNFDFTQGYFDVVRDFYITGTHQFNYQTDQTSTINAESMLHFDVGTSFKYDPSVSSSTLLQFADSTSKLSLLSATLHVSNKGLQLTKGTIRVDGRSYFVNDGTSTAEGIILGDGVTSANNVTLRTLPEGTLEVTGFIVNKTI